MDWDFPRLRAAVLRPRTNCGSVDTEGRLSQHAQRIRFISWAGAVDFIEADFMKCCLEKRVIREHEAISQ